jgi:hypothetical protein
VADAAAALARRNRRTLFGAMGFVGVMVGISFAAVPLYDLFCRATGYAGTPMLGSAAPGAVEAAGAAAGAAAGWAGVVGAAASEGAAGLASASELDSPPPAGFPPFPSRKSVTYQPEPLS